jgi:hypothetical protein
MADIEDLQRRVDNVLSGRGRGNEYVLPTQGLRLFAFPRPDAAGVVL